MSQDLKKSVISSLFWKLLERGGTNGIQFIVQIVLARLLEPKDFGLIALALAFTTIFGVLIQSGFNKSLIQRLNVSETDFSSVFFLNILLSILFYVIIFFSAPFLSVFFKESELTEVLRVMSLTLFIGAFNSVQISIISRKMQFKKFFYSSLIGIVTSGAFGIVFALNGFGIWALVVYYLINSFLIAVTLWFTVKWRPTFEFSFNSIRSLFSFGWKILLTDLIYVIYNDLRTFMIGKFYMSTELGYYNRGTQFPSVIVANIDGSIQSVLFPALSSQQENIVRVKEITRRSIKTSSFILMPLMIGLAVIAEPFLVLLLTEKWLPAVPYLQIFCIYYAFVPIHSVNLQAINSIGRSDITLKLQIVRRSIDLVILLITISHGVLMIAFGAMLSSIFTYFINAYPNKKLINYSFADQLKDVIPSILISFIVGLMIFLISFINIPIICLLFLQALSGAIFYIFLSKLFKVEAYCYLIAILKNMWNKNR